jgi:5-methyltetrahydrofolate--homocysteine methyltransferase
MNETKLTIIGDTINNAFARARKAFVARSLPDYQRLARTQVECGAHILDVNLDGTQSLQVKPAEMLAFLPELIPALQEAAPVPLCFDNPSVDYHRVALQHYDAGKSGAPVLNSVAASRERLDEMLELVAAYDASVIVMASEQFVPGGSAQCLSARDAHAAAKHFVELLVTKARRRPGQIIIDPGLAPVGADTYGLVNIGLDAMRLIRADPDLAGVHLTVGLSNFAWGMPKGVREQLEKAFLTIGFEAGLDYAIASAEKSPAPLPADHPMVAQLRAALAAGRAGEGETAADAGYRQAEAIMAICHDAAPVDS